MMTDPKPFGLADWLLLLLTLVVAAGVRIGYLASCADLARNEGPLRVQDAASPLELPDNAIPGKSHPTQRDALIFNVKQYTWFGSLSPLADKEEAVADVSPGYPWLAGMAAKVLGENTEPGLRWVQCGLGAVTAALYFLFAHRAFRCTGVAAVAGLGCALHPLWILDVALIDDGVLASFLLALTLWLGSWAGQSGGAFTSLLYGLTLAGLALVRAAFLPFGFIGLAWFLLRSRTVPRGWLCGLLAFLGFANGLAPWTVRNALKFGEPMPIVDSTYLHLWIGNNPHATGGPLPEEELLAKLPAGQPASKSASPQVQQRYTQLANEVVKEVREHPEATLRRRAWAMVAFWTGERFLTEQRLTDPGTEPGPSWMAAAPAALVAWMMALAVLALLGWRWTFAWRRETILAMLAVFWVPAPYILGHAEALQGARLPLDGVLITFAAFALVALVPGVRPSLLDGPQAAPPSRSEPE
jgi:hypothetical protein